VEILLNEGRVTFERTYITKYGKEIPVEINSHIFDLKGKKVALSVARDITDRKKAEKAILESEAKYRSLIESAKDPISVVDYDGIFLLANTAGAHNLNMETSDLIGKSLTDIFPESSKRQIESIRRVFDTGKGFEVELPVEHEGVVGWYSSSLQPLFDSENEVKSVQIISRDITEIMETQRKLQEALEQKEMLLKEIHHRVKNNLMIISSLLSIQSRFIKDKEALGIFKESQNRAKSMALIHERLYKSTDLKRIDMGDYIRTLANDLFHTYITNNQKIEIKLDVEDIMVDINTSIPLGLIINEIITNALKHAFPDDMSGTILISFNRLGDKLKLEVSDDGIGFPKDLDYKNTSSMGLQLVNSLSDQIDAELNVIMEKGTCFQIIFPEKTF
jgi:PAS domain S-box-containing protein